MLSRGAAGIKSAVGIQPNTAGYSEDQENPHLDALSSRCKEYIEDLEENPTDEALDHRKDILREFRGMCSVAGIEEEDVLEWRHFPDLCEDDWLFIEAIQEYTNWAISQDKDDRPIDALEMGRIYSHSIDRFERQKNRENKFQKYAEYLTDTKAECDCGTIRGIIAVRRIANGG